MEDRDYIAFIRMNRLNEQLKLVFTTKLPLCGECIEFHGKQITCDDVAEMMAVDAELWQIAVG